MAAEKHVAIDGVELEYFEAGEGTALLWLHGFLERPRWYDVHERLSQSYRVFAPSHPGFGRSTRPDWLSSVEDLALFYLDVLDHLGVERTYVVGHGLGGWVAAQMAVYAGQRIGKLVLLDAVGLPAPGGPVRAAGGSIADWLVLEPEVLRPLAWHDAATGQLLKLPGEEMPDEELVAILRDREAATVYGWKPFFYSPRLAHWLHRISAPTLVVWGEHDGVVPRSIGEAYVQGIAGARLEVVPGTAHVPHLEKPHDVARAVREFLS